MHLTNAECNEIYYLYFLAYFERLTIAAKAAFRARLMERINERTYAGEREYWGSAAGDAT